MGYDYTSAASLFAHDRIWLHFWPIPMGPFSRVVLIFGSWSALVKPLTAALYQSLDRNGP